MFSSSGGEFSQSSCASLSVLENLKPERAWREEVGEGGRGDRPLRPALRGFGTWEDDGPL